MITRRDALLGTSAMIAAAVAPRIPHAQDAASMIDPTIYKIGGGPLRAGDIGIGRTVVAVFDGRNWRAMPLDPEPGPAEPGPHSGPPAGFPDPARPA